MLIQIPSETIKMRELFPTKGDQETWIGVPEKQGLLTPGEKAGGSRNEPHIYEDVHGASKVEFTVQFTFN